VCSAPVDVDRRAPTVFLSYASEDRQAARRIGDVLPSYGLEVWYDESELGGGDAWDQKIRRQIRDCDYFLALISAQTEARHEGYFRREWRLAVERTLDMADDHTFLLPMVIDDTAQAGARVPEKFLAVQWLRVPGGESTPALEALCRRLAAGESPEPAAARRPGPRPTQNAPASAGPAFPEFPREEPGQRVRFFFHVIGWALLSAWLLFKRQRRWVRILVSVWLCVLLLSKGCTRSHHEASEVPAEKAQKLKELADQYQGSQNSADIAKLGAQIAREASNEVSGAARRSALLAVPFAAPPGDAAGAKLADAAFAQVYGRISVSHGRMVGLEALSSRTLAATLQHARAKHSTYLLWGSVDGKEGTQTLTVKILAVEDGSVEWSRSYAVADADPVKIATDVDSNVPSLEDE
jgi:hypothetical protein